MKIKEWELPKYGLAAKITALGVVGSDKFYDYCEKVLGINRLYYFDFKQEQWYKAEFGLDPNQFYGVSDSDFKKLKKFKNRKPDVVWVKDQLPTKEDTNGDNLVSIYDEDCIGNVDLTHFHHVTSTGRPWAKLKYTEHYTDKNPAPHPFDQKR